MLLTLYKRVKKNKTYFKTYWMKSTTGVMLVDKR